MTTPWPNRQVPVDELPWLRLDSRMLLIHPITELVRLLPVLAISLVLGSQSGNHVWGLIVVALAVGAAMLRWFTTGYRVGADDVQLRRGLLRRTVLSIPRGRIRSVDVRAGPLHRLLGLSILTVGTGLQKSDRSDTFELNALASDLVPALRTELLSGDSAPPDVALTAHSPEREIAHFRTGWVRFAPFTATGIVVVGAGFGLVFQSGFAGDVASSSAVNESYQAILRLGVVVALVLAALALLVVSSIVSVLRYLVVYGNLTVTDDGEHLRIGHGLLSTRHTTLDRDRLRGASLRRPLVLRWARGARLDAVMTGVSASEKESSLLLPPAPLKDALGTMNAVLSGLPGRAVAAVPLQSHGPAALRRRLTRALGPVALGALALAVYRSTGREVPFAAWVVAVLLAVAACALAVDRYRALGHLAAPGVLITEHGSLDRRRVVLDTDGVVAWGVRETFFQRRAGVATVIAATAAGTGSYRVIDVPVDWSASVIETAKPGSGDIWITRR
ncbi:hypothetical protein ASG56_02190 [Rhodococcus sp. Leaf7]|uniref:PH domain-containing protein n=2 Tax=unclassified Rhodococcus (in: high G+C Gram-positive bacteria) TaxID=192944 RepID=UPI0006F41A73|nr:MULTISPECIES: PH domain-containing protein [unclassified Rhodococcus (in: high G+C Gram-positive bacteria)]KQU06503.1 hypothetical protein ASG56_02190 [Rhodococcus sp. Leaf7]KQU42021.1 hypothetical protein ASG64_02190 [Rhodococcus sp. Leaf247]